MTGVSLTRVVATGGAAGPAATCPRLTVPSSKSAR